jgi:ribosomal protein L22
MAEPREPETSEEPGASADAEAPEAPAKPAPRKRAPRKPAAEKAEGKPSRKPAAKASAKAAEEATAPEDEEAVADEPQPEAVADEPRAAAPEADEPAVQAAPVRARRADADGAPRVEVRAQAKYVRTSARKARLVCDHIRGKSVEEAFAILAHTPRHVAEDWRKLLQSAVANAEHNHELVGDDLRIASVHADEGPTLKRFRPRAQGRASRIRKRTSHLTITLKPRD